MPGWRMVEESSLASGVDSYRLWLHSFIFLNSATVEHVNIGRNSNHIKNKLHILTRVSLKGLTRDDNGIITKCDLHHVLNIFGVST